MNGNVKIRVDQFLELMKHDGVPLVSVGALDWLIENGFFTAPASTKYHGAFEGGLFEHSYNVTVSLLTLTKNEGLIWQKSRSPYIVGMFHDLCKIDQYQHMTMGELLNGDLIESSRWEYNPNTLLKGHGDKSVMLLSQFTDLTEEEILCIRYHMGAFTDRDEWNDYTRAIHVYPNVLWTHHADMLAAHVHEIRERS